MIDLVPAVVLSHGPGGLGAVRSLARRGVRVTALAYDHNDPVLRSRYPSRKIAVAGRDDDEKEAFILNFLTAMPDQGAVILTTSDRAISFLSNHRTLLRDKFCFTIPSPERLDELNDKRKETELVENLGFAIPETIKELPSTADELASSLRFPIIFKPYSVFVQDVFPEKNAIVQNQTELDEFYIEWSNVLDVFVAQEVIAGPDHYSWICSCTFDEEHRILDCAIKQKLRALPAHFGGSCYAVCEDNDSILRLAEELGARLTYVGHAGIEFRWDDRDEEYKYIELNPRLPANVGFDEACGLPTVWNTYLISQGRSVASSGAKQKTGLYYLDLKSDFFSLLADKTPLSRIVAGYFRLLFVRTNGLYFAWDDPGPGIATAFKFCRRIFRSLLRKTRQKFLRNSHR